MKSTQTIIAILLVIIVSLVVINTFFLGEDVSVTGSYDAAFGSNNDLTKTFKDSFVSLKKMGDSCTVTSTGPSGSGSCKGTKKDTYNGKIQSDGTCGELSLANTDYVCGGAAVCKQCSYDCQESQKPQPPAPVNPPNGCDGPWMVTYDAPYYDQNACVYITGESRVCDVACGAPVLPTWSCSDSVTLQYYALDELDCSVEGPLEAKCDTMSSTSTCVEISTPPGAKCSDFDTP